MNPRVPELLSRLLDLAARTLERPSGDARRVALAETLVEQVFEGAGWATDTPPRLINDFTLMLAKLLRLIEREGPLGDREIIVRAETVARALLPFVQADASRAMALAARPSNGNERRRA